MKVTKGRAQPQIHMQPCESTCPKEPSTVEVLCELHARVQASGGLDVAREVLWVVSTQDTVLGTAVKSPQGLSTVSEGPGHSAA